MDTIEASTTTAPAVVTSAAPTTEAPAATTRSIPTDPSTHLPAQLTEPVRPRATWIDATDPRTGRIGVQMRWWLPRATSVAGAA